MSGTGDLDVARIEARLRTQSFGRSLRLLESTASTNDDARSDAATGVPEGHCVVADHQTQGRGSQGRVWASPAGTDLYVSILARPKLELATLPKLTLAVGLGVSRAADALLRAHGSDLRTSVKWPNDVWLGDHKLAGVLVEASATGDAIGPVILGIGLNVNRERFADDLTSSATSLRLACGEGAAAFDRVEALCTLLEQVEHALQRFVLEGPAATIAEVAARLALRGREVTLDSVEGTLIGLAPSGAIHIKSTDGGLAEHFAGRLLPRR